MRIALYTPLKPPDHPVPSGDRRVARQIIEALRLAGHDVELAARLRSFDGGGSVERQMRLATIGGKLAQRYVHRQLARPFKERPVAWITYHLYHKAPDWIGPRAAAKLGIPYVVIEASVAGKRAGGPWSLGHEATIAALARAAAVISLNPRDEPGIAPHVSSRDRLHQVKPFLDAAPYRDAAKSRAIHRAELAQRTGLDPNVPWLLAVAMMRSGDKLESYKLLAEACAKLRMPPATVIAGDGPAARDVHEAFGPLGARAAFLGRVDEDVLPSVYAACDLLVWPAVNEAFGMAILEAQAAGLPVIAGDSGGVGTIVSDGTTGRLVVPRDADALAAAMAPALADAGLRRRWSEAALAKVRDEHDLPVAAARLDAIIRSALKVGAYA